MVNEVTMICMDTSSWMEHHTSNKFLSQIDAIGVYCEKYFKSHPDNYVGIMAMGGMKECLSFYIPQSPIYHEYYVVEPTKDLSLIMSRIRGVKDVGDHDTLLVPALEMASCDLNKKHKNLLKRLVVFVAGRLGDDGNAFTKLGTLIKERGVAVDVVNFGYQQNEYKKHQLLVLLAAVNNNDNTRMLDLWGHRLNGSSVTPLVVGQGERCLHADYLLQGEKLRTAKNQYDKVHGVTMQSIGYLFRELMRIRDEKRERCNRVRDRRNPKIRDWNTGKDIHLDHTAGKERYQVRGARYELDRVRDEKTKRCNRVGDRRNPEIRDLDIGKDIHLDDTARKERYQDRGARYGRERYYRCHDDDRGRDRW